MLGRLARRAGVRPTELLEGIYSLRNCDAARHLYRVTSGLESMVVGEAEVQGQVKRAYEAALSSAVHRPADEQALPRRPGDGQARPHGDRDLRRARERRVGRRGRRPRRARRPRQPPRADHRGRRDGRGHGPRAARAGRAHDVRRQPPARARARAGPALRRRRRSRSTRCPPSSRGRHRRRLDLFAASDPRRRGARAGDAGASGPAVAADRPRGAARHRSGVRRAAGRDAL